LQESSVNATCKNNFTDNLLFFVSMHRETF